MGQNDSSSESCNSIRLNTRRNSAATGAARLVVLLGILGLVSAVACPAVFTPGGTQTNFIIAVTSPDGSNLPHEFDRPPAVVDFG
jgi:hypothetical protein